MKKHSARLKNKGFHKLKVIDIKLGNKRRSGEPVIKEFVLDYPNKDKILVLRPTKGYKLESVK